MWWEIIVYISVDGEYSERLEKVLVNRFIKICSDDYRFFFLKFLEFYEIELLIEFVKIEF